MNFVIALAHSRGIRRSGVQFLLGTQNSSLSHARDKTENIFLHFFTELKTYHLSYYLRMDLLTKCSAIFFHNQANFVHDVQ